MLSFESGARELLAVSLASCGGPIGPFYQLAGKLSGDDELSFKDEELIRTVLPTTSNSVTTISIWKKFASIEHYQEMKEQAEMGLFSVAHEIPKEIRPLLHTFLPIDEKGTYTNKGRVLTLKGLVPLGPQRGQLVAHLGAVFSARLPKGQVEQFKQEQAEHVELLMNVDKLDEFDFTGLKLRALTEIAKEKLGL